MSLSGRGPSISFGNRSFARTPHWGDSLLRNRKTFQRLLVLFFRFSAGTSEVILLSQRLALKYNTIHPPVWQPLFSTFFALFSRFSLFTSFLRGTCISFDAIKASMRLGRTGAFCSLFYIYYTLLLPSDLFQMGGQFHVFTVVHRHHDDAGHALPERFFQCGDQSSAFSTRYPLQCMASASIRNDALCHHGVDHRDVQASTSRQSTRTCAVVFNGRSG